MRKEKKRPD